MAKEKVKLRDVLNSYKFAYDVMQKIPCSKAENKQYQQILKEGGILPDGVYAYIDELGVASTVGNVLSNQNTSELTMLLFPKVSSTYIHNFQSLSESVSFVIGLWIWIVCPFVSSVVS